MHRDSLLDQLNGDVVTIYVMGKNAYKMQCVGVLGVYRQDTPVKLFRFSQSSGLMMPQAFVDQILNDRVLSPALIGMGAVRNSINNIPQ